MSALTSDERDQVQTELADTERVRARLLTARDANPHLSHWKLPLQLAASDRHIARLRALLEDDEESYSTADHGRDLDGPRAVVSRGGAS